MDKSSAVFYGSSGAEPSRDQPGNNSRLSSHPTPMVAAGEAGAPGHQLNHAAQNQMILEMPTHSTGSQKKPVPKASSSPQQKLHINLSQQQLRYPSGVKFGEEEIIMTGGANVKSFSNIKSERKYSNR